MSDLAEYLVQKRAALRDRRRAVEEGALGVVPFLARASAEGRSGIRRTRIRDFQIISDSPPGFAGYDLGPGSPEILLGALSSCLVHTWLIHAADQEVQLDSLEAEVRGQLDPRSGRPGFEDVPVYPHDISYRVLIRSPATPGQIESVSAAVERLCPVLNLLIRATAIRGEVVHSQPDAA